MILLIRSLGRPDDFINLFGSGSPNGDIIVNASRSRRGQTGDHDPREVAGLKLSVFGSGGVRSIQA